jgi:diguanylate cyclase (GGDEF)-like protein
VNINKTRRTIGLLIDDLAGRGFGDYFQANVLAGVADMSRMQDVNLLCFAAGNLDSPNEWVRSRNILFEFIDDNKVDGLIVLTTAIGLRASNQRVLEKLQQYQGIPIVTIGDTFEQHYSVSVNNYKGMREAIEHIILEHKRKHIAFIKGAAGSLEAKDRYRAYLDVLKDHNIPFDEKLVYQGNFLFDSGAKAIRTLNENNAAYDAVVAANDYMAIGAMTEILKTDGKLPEHLSVIGFDDIEPGEMLSLTTVKQSFYNQAQTATAKLLRLINGEPVQKNKESDSRLVIRSSCGCVPKILTETSLDYNSIVPSKDPSAQQLQESFMAYMDQMISATPGLIKLNAYQAIKSDLEHLPQALVQELFFEKDRMFFYAWRSIIFHAIQHKIDLSFLHKALSSLRLLTLDTVKGNAHGYARAENLFQMARIQISEAVQRTSVSLTYMSSLLSDQLEQLGEELVTHLDMPDLLDVIYQEFPNHGIQEAYICLYEDPAKPMDTARLILAYRNGERIDSGESGIMFPTADLLPREMLTEMEDYRHQFIVQTLHHTNHHIGYAIFSFENRVNKAYELLRYRLSNALRVSILINDVKSHSMELESQVIARTKELSELNQELRIQSIRDELTGLLNRRGFMRRGKEAFETAVRDHSRLLLIYADLDSLKKINDIHGHAEGDQAIIMAADVLKQSFGPNDIISRLAGDEFTVIFGTTDQTTVEEIRRNIQTYSAQINQLHDKPFEFSLSMGFAEYGPNNPCTFERLMQLADEDLYRDKKAKKRA